MSFHQPDLNGEVIQSPNMSFSLSERRNMSFSKIIFLHARTYALGSRIAFLEFWLLGAAPGWTLSLNIKYKILCTYFATMVHFCASYHAKIQHVCFSNKKTKIRCSKQAVIWHSTCILSTYHNICVLSVKINEQLTWTYTYFFCNSLTFIK